MKRKVNRSSVSGEFVDRQTAKDSPESTYADTVDLSLNKELRENIERVRFLSSIPFDALEEADWDALSATLTRTLDLIEGK